MNQVRLIPLRQPSYRILCVRICKERNLIMKKTMKKCLARALALAVVASMTCSYAFAAS